MQDTLATINVMIVCYKTLYPSAWADQRGPLGEKISPSGFGCHTISILQSFISITILLITRCEVATCGINMQAETTCLMKW